MDTVTRHSCGFATFDQCDPTTCTEPCFTARVIAINGRHECEAARIARFKLAVIPAAVIAFVSLVALSLALPEIIDRVVMAHQEV